MPINALTQSSSNLSVRHRWRAGRLFPDRGGCCVGVVICAEVTAATRAAECLGPPCLAPQGFFSGQQGPSPLQPVLDCFRRACMLNRLVFGRCRTRLFCDCANSLFATGITNDTASGGRRFLAVAGGGYLACHCCGHLLQVCGDGCMLHVRISHYNDLNMWGGECS